jgi:hypothetical protein
VSVPATTAIAIYGAILSTGVALWQLYTWWASRRIKVEISVFDDGEGYLDLVVVRVVNHGDQEISINEIGLVGEDCVYHRFDWKVRWDHRGLPVPIATHQQLEVVCLAEAVATRRGMNTDDPVMVRVRLGDNSVHESRPTKIDPTF